ncbi:hypothetical protein [Streptomyces rapamycinicus]|nr:hypothetical protein [Streptomyces rapamycinicus]MBB4782980.1 hypothetical protein [Streptomyces rapamycinicus]UTO63432.1 hypothetical protein LJB45_14590 [Streptomyces rapamycinicus]UTP31389.1 hypothetical protein LIV37_19705 [Streptomyces rapamycinicus NRRL 5491]
MQDNAASRLAPPSPLPKRRNSVFRLYDAPLYRDWAFWNTAGWGLIAGISIPTTPPTEPTPLSLWLDTLLAIVIFVAVLGVIPAWLRLVIRRWRWSRHQQSPRYDVPASPARTAQETVAAPPLGPPPPQASPGMALGSATAPSARSTACRPESVERSVVPAELLADARNALPHPVARAVRALQQAYTPKEKYEALLDAAETLAITVSLTAAALLQGRIESRSGSEGHGQGLGQNNLSALRKAYLGRGVMFGTWTTWLDRLRPLAADHPDLVIGLHHALKDTPDDAGIVGHLDVLREERNRAAHGNKPKSQPESALRVAECTHHLEHALAKAQFLKNLSWLFTVSCVYQPRLRTFDVVAEDAMGDHPDFERRTFTWDRPVGNELFYLLGPGGPVSLSPFVANLFCSQCRQMEVCYAYKVGKGDGSAIFKSFGRGHEIVAPGMGDEIRSLPDQG